MDIALRERVRLRAKGVCDLCGLPARSSTHVHHRAPRGMGGSKQRDRLSNLLWLHSACHLAVIEPNRARAYEAGWLVKAGEEPAAVPVLLFDGWALLDDEGGVTQTGAAGLDPSG